MHLFRQKSTESLSSLPKSNFNFLTIHLPLCAILSKSTKKKNWTRNTLTHLLSGAQKCNYQKLNSPKRRPIKNQSTFSIIIIINLTNCQKVIKLQSITYLVGSGSTYASPQAAKSHSLEAQSKSLST
jgi:hypothetical protein